MPRTRVTEIVNVKVERWKHGKRKPDTETIQIRRVRSTQDGGIATSVDELAMRLLGINPPKKRSLPRPKGPSEDKS